ncbi:hypothetical protein [Nonlabens ulvanivorans]|uniref:hypothetical protein n=1 Tax=Nonlabens ulvanivorans TaxID=906888 RepID=UPI0037C83427
MKIKILLLILIVISFSCTEDDGTATTITCTDNTYYALRSSNMGNPNGVIDVIQNTTSNITTSSFTVNGGIGISNSLRNHPSAWDKINKRFVWFDQEEGVDGFVYDETSNTLNNFSLPATAQTNLGRFTAPVFFQGVLYVLDFDANPAAPRFDIHIMSPSNGSIGPSLGQVLFNPGTLVTDGSFTFATSTTNDVDTIYFRVGNDIIYFNPISGIITDYRSINGIGGFTTGLEYNADKDVFYAVTDNQGSIDLLEIKINGANNYSVTVLEDNLNINMDSVSIEWKDCGKRLHIVTNFPGSPSSGGQDISEIIEFNLDASPSFVTQSFNGFIFGFVHKQV